MHKSRYPQQRPFVTHKFFIKSKYADVPIEEEITNWVDVVCITAIAPATGRQPLSPTTKPKGNTNAVDVKALSIYLKMLILFVI